MLGTGNLVSIPLLQLEYIDEPKKWISHFWITVIELVDTPYFSSWFQRNFSPSWWGSHGIKSSLIHGAGSVLWRFFVWGQTKKQRARTKSKIGLIFKRLPLVAYFHPTGPISLRFYHIQNKTTDWGPSIRNISLWGTFQIQIMTGNWFESSKWWQCSWRYEHEFT